jgi:hypothetical protein
MDHALAVRKGEAVADLLENGEQRRERVFLHRLGHALREELEDLFERDAAHELHRVERLIVLVHAQLVNRHDVRVLELAGDLRFLDEAGDVVGGTVVEHHLHRHGAADRRFLRVEDRAHAALRDDSADVVFLLALDFLGQKLAHRCRRGRERDIRRRLRLHPAQLDGGRADLDFLPRPQLRRFGDRLAIDRGAIGAGEVFDEHLVVIDDELRVLARDELGLELDIRLRPPPEHIVPRRHHPPDEHVAAFAHDDFCFRNEHHFFSAAFCLS